MGEAKRRKILDPNFGKVPRAKKNTQLDLELFEQYMDLPLSEYTAPEHQELVEKGVEQLFLIAQEAGIKLPPMPTDPMEKQRLLRRFAQGMANSRLQLPDGSILR